MWNNPLIGDYHPFSGSDLQLHTRLAAILEHTATVKGITILACLTVLEKKGHGKRLMHLPSCMHGALRLK